MATDPNCHDCGEKAPIGFAMVIHGELLEGIRCLSCMRAKLKDKTVDRLTEAYKALEPMVEKEIT